MLRILGEFLGGYAVGTLLALVEIADEQATARCAADAQVRVDRLRHDADVRLHGVYDRHAHWMGPATKAAYHRRLGW
ncbi:MAG: hypothetical protein JXB32_14875 [Deltaproteobacteria bacterium]|nr:hypothetical protein [Deltaproteobacteria bacterium]